jgi:hypothetical protein
MMEDQDSVTDKSWSGPTSDVIPSSLVVLAAKRYLGCQSLETVFFESGSRLERIEESSFSRSGLKSIHIPSSVVCLDKESFAWCASLERVTFENGSRLERIGPMAFSRSGLQSIQIPSSVVFLRESSFYDCKSLESVTFESGSRLELIGEAAFSLSGLKSIVIPSSVSSLFEFSFYGCKALESVTFESDCHLKMICHNAFSLSGLKSIVIPSSLVCLGNLCFCDCKSLESVTFESDYIAYLGESVFKGTQFEAVSALINPGRDPWTVNPDSSPQMASSRAIGYGQEEIPGNICTLDDVNRFIEIMIGRAARICEVSSAIETIEKVVQYVVGRKDLGDRRFAILHKMNRNFRDAYPEVEAIIRSEMKELNSKEDCYSSAEYAKLGAKIWGGMYDEMSGTFQPGMYDLREIGVVIDILGSRDFPLFRRAIIPELQKHELDEFIPREIWRKDETWTANSDFAPLRCPGRAIISGKGQVQESISTLKDIDELTRLVDAQEAPFDEVNSAVETLERVVQYVVGREDLGDRRFAMLHKMQCNFRNAYPEVEAIIRSEMKELNSKEDCYSSAEYAKLGAKIWGSMYDGMSGTFQPGMNDLDEICAVIDILGSRDFPLFRRAILPPLRRYGLHIYIRSNLLSKADEENARELAALHWATRTLGK